MPYYRLTKPGIIYGNTMTAAAGFLFASGTSVDWTLMLMTLLGFALATGSACVINNVLDRDIDARMERTRGREVSSGRIPVRNAVAFGSALGIAGLLLLFFWTNLVSLGVLLFGYCMYLIVYTVAKRRTHYFTYAGALAGAVPPVVGYTAVAGVLDAPAFVLYLILILWQMAHFYSISIYRQDEYAAAHIPVLPLEKGIRRTILEILIFTVLFAIAALWLAAVHRTGIAYLVIVSVASTLWAALAVSGLHAEDTKRWARRMFLFSLLVILSVSLALSLTAFS